MFQIPSDTFVIRGSSLGVLEKESVYSDASVLTIENNRIESAKEGAFDASVRT